MNLHLIDIGLLIISGWFIYRGVKNGIKGIIIGIIKAVVLPCIIVIILSKTPVDLIQNEISKNIIPPKLLTIIPKAYNFTTDKWDFKYKKNIANFLAYEG